MQDFSGLWIPLVTPFEGGAVDHAALKRLVIHLGEQPIAGFVACGSTGEAALLTDEESEAVQYTVLEASVRPVVLGVSGTTAAEVIAALRRTWPKAIGLPGLMAICHRSSRPSASTAGLRWPSSPTVTPPLVTIRS